MRGDAAGLLVGHDAISAFRGVRGGVPPRVIERIETASSPPMPRCSSRSPASPAAAPACRPRCGQRIDGRWLHHRGPRHARARRRSTARCGARSATRSGRARGRARSPGCTVAVKDLFAIKGYRIGAGNPTYLRDAARRDHDRAPRSTDLLRGGASLRGIARTDEFAYSIAGDNAHYGTPPNGAVPGALPGRLVERSGLRRRHRPGRDRPRHRHRRVGPRARVVPGALGAAHDARAGPPAGPAAARAVVRHGRLAHPRRRDAAARRRLVPELRRVGVDRERVRRVRRRPAVALRRADRGARRGRARDPRRVRRVAATLASSTDAARRRSVSIGDLDEYFAPFRTVQGAEAWRNNGEWVTRAPRCARPGRRGAVRDRASAHHAPRRRPPRAAPSSRSPRAVHALVADAVLLHADRRPAPRRCAPPSASASNAVRAATLRMTTPGRDRRAARRCRRRCSPCARTSAARRWASA